MLIVFQLVNKFHVFNVQGNPLAPDTKAVLNGTESTV